MNNSTISNNGWQNLPVYMVYSFQGFIISSSNLMIVFSILRYEALRTSKEYLVMLGLSLADSCSMSGFLTAGVYRIYLVVSEQYNEKRTPWQCATVLHNIILIIGVIWGNIMLAVVSLDRLLCVSMPLSYIGWTINYSQAVLFLPFCGGLIYGGIYWVVTYLINEGAQQVSAPCATYSVLKDAPSSFTFIFQMVPSFFAFLSVLIYIIVWYKYKKHFAQTEPISGGQSLQDEQLRRQRRITVSLAISCVCTFILFCVPMMAANILLYFGFYKVAVLFYMITTINPLCNVFIYQIRHRELRMALTGLLACKNLPIDIRMWNVNQAATSAA